jgi:hypothetical protein
MSNGRSQSSWLLLAACFAGLGLGLYFLFMARFERGDVYPPYSSLRADPLGTMAFYESLNALSGIRATRDFAAVNRLPDGRNTSYLHIAGSVAEWQALPEDAIDEVERFIGGGGRLVITLHPRSAAGSWRELWEEGRTNLTRSTRRESAPFLSGRWGIRFRIEDLEQDAGGTYEPVTVRNRSGSDLPPTIEWHSGIVCSPGADWNTIYARGEDAVVVERRFGRGSVVIATDSYFVSNEAMLLDRYPSFLAWLVGPVRNVVFDEAHLGVTESPGVVSLMRRYRLHGVVTGMALLAALFLWKNACSLIPRRAGLDVSNEMLTGKDAAAGFVNLLRRFVPPAELLSTCHAEWTATVAREGTVPPARAQHANDIYQADRAAGGKNPVETYRLIAQSLQTRNPASIGTDKPSS